MNPFAFGENSDFLVGGHHQRRFLAIVYLYSVVLFPTHDLGGIKHSLLLHIIFKLHLKE